MAIMRATLVAAIELTRRALAVEQRGEQFFVAFNDGVSTLRGESLEPVVDGIELLQLREGQVLTRDRLIGLDGTTLPLPSFKDARATRFAPLPDGALLAVSPQRRKDAAAVLRLDARGVVVWRASTAPPAGGTWKPAQWNINYGDLHLSGDRALAIYADMPRSGIGIGYGLDVETGAVIYTTVPAPYQRITSAPIPGSFLVGIQGYGAFETRFVDCAGSVQMTWPSHGIVIPGNPVRLIELENVLPSRMRIATLLDDGRVRHGVCLPGYHTSPVIVAADHSAVFWRDNTLLRVTPDERIEPLLPTTLGEHAYSSAFAGTIPGRVVLHVSAMASASSQLFVIDIA